jgi:hypothetical protein
MISAPIIEIATWIWIGVAVVTFISLITLKVRAPYGRHSRQGWGKMIDNHWGWFWMELPALVIFPLIALLGPVEKTSLHWILIALWIIHYTNRTLIFPFRLKTKGKKIPISIVYSATFFNLINGVLNGYAIGYMALPTVPTPIFMTGVLIFIIGFYINQRADNYLIGLRKKQSGYSLPKGWLFNRISCPNLFGEIIEWIGFALAACSLQAFSFAIWTFANLVPRAMNHHDWYRETFDDYPDQRKAVIPYIL